MTDIRVIQKRITSNESRPKVMSILISLLTGALETDTARAEVIVFILAELQQGEQNATVKVGRKEITIYPGHINYRVPANISDSGSLVQFLA